MKRLNIKTLLCEIVLDIYIVLMVYLNRGFLPENILFLLLLFGLVGYIIHLSMPYICACKITQADTSIDNRILFFIASGICLIPLLLSWISYWPGGLNLDALGQWDQVQCGYLNDWHPVMSTLFIYAVTRISNSFSFYIFTQILLFSLSIGYLSMSMNRMKIPIVYNIISVLYTALNPASHYMMTCMYKDATFAIFVVILIGQLLNIYRTNGMWIKERKNSVALIIVMIMISLVRHNGIFITLPAAALLLLFYRELWKRISTLTFLFLIIFGLIKGPLYNELEVVNHENVYGEMMGVPMAILANELVYSPETIDIDTHRFLNTIAPDEEWNKRYITGEWDSVKWDFGGAELLKDENPIKILRYTIKSIIREPNCAFESFASNTKVAFQFIGNVYWNDEPYIEDNEYGIAMSNDNTGRRILTHFADLTSKIGISTLFWCIGAYMLILILFAISRIINENYKILLLVLPIILYNFGTSMMLSGPSYRYFYFNVPIFCSLLISTLYEFSYDDTN